MTSCQRVWAAINHQEPDRVPLDIGGGSSTTIVIEGYERLKEYWGLAGSPEAVHAEVRQRMRDLGPGVGYIVAPAHNIQPDVSPENIMAMAEEPGSMGPTHSRLNV